MPVDLTRFTEAKKASSFDEDFSTRGEELKKKFGTNNLDFESTAALLPTISGVIDYADSKSQSFAFNSTDEVKAYLQDSNLKKNLKDVLSNLPKDFQDADPKIKDVVYACVTLFAIVAEGTDKKFFSDIISEHFNSEAHTKTRDTLYELSERERLASLVTAPNDRSGEEKKTLIKEKLDFLRNGQKKETDGLQNALSDIANENSGSWVHAMLPQYKGIGRSSTSKKHSLNSIEEAEAYLADDELRNNSVKLIKALLAAKENSEDPEEDVLDKIFSRPHEQHIEKLHASLTLLAIAAERNTPQTDKFFTNALFTLFPNDDSNEVFHQRTLELLNKDRVSYVLPVPKPQQAISLPDSDSSAQSSQFFDEGTNTTYSRSTTPDHNDRFTVVLSKDESEIEVQVNETRQIAKGSVYRSIEKIGKNQISNGASIVKVKKNAQEIVNTADRIFQQTISPEKVDPGQLNEVVREAMTSLLKDEYEELVLERFSNFYGDLLKPPQTKSNLQSLHYHPEEINAWRKFNKENLVFVFGSNLDGLHGAGAADGAMKNFKAEWKNPEGRQGMSYAIPTLGKAGASLLDKRNRLPLEQIESYAKDFIQYAEQNPHEIFYVTSLGSKIANYSKEDQNKIAESFAGAPPNCSFSESWRIPIENKRLEIAAEQGLIYIPNLLPDEVYQQNKDKHKAISSVQQTATPTPSTIELKDSPAELVESYPHELKEKYVVRPSGNVYKIDAPRGSEPVLNDNGHSLKIMNTDEDVIKDAIVLAAHRMPKGITIKIPGLTPELADIYYEHAAKNKLPAKILVDGKEWQPSPELEQRVQAAVKALESSQPLATLIEADELNQSNTNTAIVEKAIAGLEDDLSVRKAEYSKALMNSERTAAKLVFLDVVYKGVKEDVKAIGALPNKSNIDCQKEIDARIEAHKNMLSGVVEKSKQWKDTDKNEIWESIRNYAGDNKGKIELSQIDELVKDVKKKKRERALESILTKGSDVDHTPDPGMAPLEKREGLKPLDLPMPDASIVSLDENDQWSISGESSEPFKAALDARNLKNKKMLESIKLGGIKEDAVKDVLEKEKKQIGAILMLEKILKEDYQEHPSYSKLIGIGNIETADQGDKLNGEVAYRDSKGDAYVLLEPAKGQYRAKVKIVTEEQQKVMGINLERGHILTGVGLQAGVPRSQEQHAEQMTPTAHKKKVSIS